MAKERQIRNLVIIGFMATGKSSVGKSVAKRLGFNFLDTDSMIETRLDRTISDIFANEGETWFRAYEHKLVLELKNYSNFVISTGGGLGASQVNMDSLKEHALVVCLWATPDLIWQRAKKHSHRPLLQDPDPLGKIRTLLKAREPVYKQADVLINTDRRPIRTVVQHVVMQFKSACKLVSHENSNSGTGIQVRI